MMAHGSSKYVGFTTSIPVELVLAAGRIPVDLNNRFITDPQAAALVHKAEDLGMARTLCAWIKGIYAWSLEHPEVETIVAVTQGDCSNTQALMELLSFNGKDVIPFNYPHDKDPAQLRRQMEILAERLGSNFESGEKIRGELIALRNDLKQMDRITWQEGTVSGQENQLWLLCTSDFEGDPAQYQADLKQFLQNDIVGRTPKPAKVRLGLLGVPPIMSDIHQVLEDFGAAVVFNEIPRQFAMLPKDDGTPDNLVEQYLQYTYPYDVFGRIADVAVEIKKRKIDGLVHYTQSFCYRQMQDIILRERLDIPILTLEGDRVGPVDPRTKMRLEAFVDVLR